MASKFNKEQIEELSKDLDSKFVKNRKQGSNEVSYIQAYRAIYEANAIFGFDGWDRETVYCKEVCRYEVLIGQNKTPGWKVGYEAKVLVRVAGTIGEGTGHGSGIAKDLFDAIESAAKEAESDAMKRALIKYGSRFGLALYDPNQENVVDHEAAAKEEEAKKKAELEAEKQKKEAEEKRKEMVKNRTEAEWVEIANRFEKAVKACTTIAEYNALAEKASTTLKEMREHAEIIADQVTDIAKRKQTELLNVKL